MSSAPPLPSGAGFSRQTHYFGDRSTRYGGEWQKCRLPGGSCPVSSEIDSVLNGLPRINRALARARFDKMWDRAKVGKLKFGRKDDVGEVGARPPELLEMRVQINADSPLVERRALLRLYFSEPQEITSLMLAIHFARKPSNGDPDGVQDRQIREAARRLREGRKNSFLWGITK